MLPFNLPGSERNVTRQIACFFEDMLPKFRFLSPFPLDSRICREIRAGIGCVYSNTSSIALPTESS